MTLICRLSAYLLIFSSLNLHAQENKQIDSLKLILEHSKEDTFKVDILGKIARNYNNKRLLDSAIKYGNLSLQLAEKLKYQIGMAYGNFVLGYSYLYKSADAELVNFTDTIFIRYYTNAIKIYEEIKKGDYLIVQMLNTLGSYYYNSNEELYDSTKYQIALDYFLRCLKKKEGFGYVKEKDIYFNTANAYSKLKNIPKALEFYLKALRIAEAENDKTEQITILMVIGYTYYWELDTANALQYLLKALKISDEAEIKSDLLLYYLGAVYAKQSHFSKALEYYLKALDIAKKIDSKSRLPVILLNIALAYSSRGNYADAIDYYLKALKQAEKESNVHQLANIYNQLGYMYRKLNNDSLAFQNFLKASELAKQTGIKHLILEANRSLGISYIVEKNYTKAVDYLSKSLKAAEEIDDKNEVAYILSELGEVSYLNKDYTKALEYYNQALNLSETATCKCEIPQDLNNIAKVYAALKENEKAETYFLKALSLIDTSEELGVRKFIHETLSDFYSDTGNYEKALEHYKKAVALKDSLLNESTNNKISQLKIEYETEKKDQEIANLNKEQKIKDLEIEQKKKELQAQQLEQEKKQQAIALLESSKKIQALSLQKKEEEVKNLLKEQQIKNLQIRQNEQELQTRTLEKEKQQQSINLLLSSQRIQDLQLKQKQTEIKRRTGIYIASLSLIILGIISLALYYRNKQSQQKIKNEREIAQLEQKALQLQMNPHFIFNSLNSIGHYMLKHEAELAEEFLTRFSKLTRLVLEASKESFIPLSKEIEILRYYVSLEQERFNHSFNFDITVKNNILIEEMMIPPMLVQPYIENAIIHGINKLKQRGNIEVIFQAEDNENNAKTISCIVRDNGIGINQSLQQKQEEKEKSNHRSIAMSNTKERLKVLSELYSINLDIEIKDININQTSGTEVRFDIPVKMI